VVQNRMRVGLVGSGFGLNVVLPACSVSGAARVVAVADSGTGRVARHPAFRASGARLLTPRSLLAAPDLDAVVIAVPPSAQASLVQGALAAGKHVLCEKPFGSDLATAIRLCEAAEQSRRVAAVDYEFRYDDFVSTCIRAVRKSLVGDVREIEVHWWTGGSLRPGRVWSWRDDARECGGVLTEWCSHVVDYVRLIGAAPFASVSCCMWRKVTSRIADDGRLKPVSTPDSCVLRGRLENGIRVVVKVSTARHSGHIHRVEVRGTSGVLVGEHFPPFGASDLLFVLYGSDGAVQKLEVELEGGCDTRMAAVARLVTDFAAAALGARRPLLPDCFDAVSVWRVLAAARHSTRLDAQPVEVKVGNS